MPEENHQPHAEPGSNGPQQNHFVPSASTGHTRQREALLPHNRFVVWFLKSFGCLLLLLYFILPAFIKCYPAIIVDVAFLNHFYWPPFLNLSRPADSELNNTAHFRIDTFEGQSVGAWHILPTDLAAGRPTDSMSIQEYNDLLDSGHPVFLYCHGNTGTRAGWHRVQLYKVLADAGYHVVTFDYRGYGDSPGYPTEEGIVDDAQVVFNWIRQHSGSAPVYIWGHSLGSAVATKLSNRLCKTGVPFNGLILESPFNNFVEAASNHPISAPFRVMSWFSWVFVESIKMYNIRFESDKNIQDVTVPTMILHAVDDGVVPYPLGRKLYEAALRRPVGDKVQFISFDGEHDYGHKHIHRAPELPAIVKKFTSEHN